MKITLTLVSLLFVFSFGCDKANSNGPASMTDSTAVMDSTAKVSGYHCPMHPEVKDSIASDCPKCGMSLIEDKKD